jgi:hypothetical protein
MSEPTGKYYSVSYFRRLVTDLVQFADTVPSATIERRMNLSRLERFTIALHTDNGHGTSRECRVG